MSETPTENGENAEKAADPPGTPNNPHEKRSESGKYRLIEYEYDGKERKYVHFPCQRHPNNSCSVPVTLGEKQARGWTFDGNLEAPTLGPSIRCLFQHEGQDKTRCHFFLKKGEFELCGDHTSDRHLDIPGKFDDEEA